MHGSQGDHAPAFGTSKMLVDVLVSMEAPDSIASPALTNHFLKSIACIDGL